MVAALVVPITAFAHAQLDVTKFGDLKAEAAACPQGTDLGAWYHFVLNQVGPTPYLEDVTITVFFGGADQTPADPVSPTAINRSTQHFDVWSNGVLTTATTTGAGSRPAGKPRALGRGLRQQERPRGPLTRSARR